MRKYIYFHEQMNFFNLLYIYLIIELIGYYYWTYKVH